MNKAQLIEALAERLGDKKTAGTAVDELVDLIVRTVNKGEKVGITGFGVFEKRARAARVARNPRTGETVRVKKTNVPAFRAGTAFKDVVSGTRKLPKAPGRAVAKTGTARAAATTTRATATRGTTARPAATRATATRATATRATATRAATTTARKTAAKAPVKAAAVKKTATKRASTRSK